MLMFLERHPQTKTDTKPQPTVHIIYTKTSFNVLTSLCEKKGLGSDEQYLYKHYMGQIKPFIEPVSLQTQSHGGAGGEYQHITISLELRDELNHIQTQN